jgi:hypothetical protein
VEQILRVGRKTKISAGIIDLEGLMKIEVDLPILREATIALGNIIQ